jgi:hypothetical protein
LTVGHALANLAGGDTLYIGAGKYREANSLSGSPNSTITVIGDTDGSNTGDFGEVSLTAYLSDDKSTPTSSVLLNLNSVSYYTFKNLVFVGGTNDIIANTGSGACLNTQFINCTFLSGLTQRMINLVTTFGVAAYNWLIERCRFSGLATNCIVIDVGSSGFVDFDTNIIIRNNVFLITSNSPVISVDSSGAAYRLGGSPGNVQVYNNTIIGGTKGINFGNGWDTVTLPAQVYNNIICSTTVGIAAITSGSVLEDYNLIYSQTSVLNITTGTHSKDEAYSILLHIGQEIQQGKLLKPFGMPTFDSPVLGFGNDGTYTSSVDILNRIRPSGPGVTWSTSGKAVGAYERHDLASRESSILDATTGAIKWRGPGDQRLYIPVNPISTSISIKNQYDSNYGGGTKPTFRLETNSSIGVSTQAVTNAGAANTYNTLALSNFTPTSKGWVIVTMESYAAGSGVVYWDTLSVQ